MMGDLEAPKSMHVSLPRDWPINVRFPPNVGRSPNVRFPPKPDISKTCPAYFSAARCEWKKSIFQFAF